MEKAEKEGRHIDAAILDLTIPWRGMGGAEFILLLRQQYSHIPVFASSGYSDAPVMSNPEAFGFTGSLSKPFDKNELSQILERYMNKKV